tara:strand:- start:194 stop:472 length:279 start_codon:yes stop_codon:yes gene_type:complete
MTVQELMERVGSTNTGLMIAYIKDAMEEMNILAETHVTTAKIDIVKDKRLYDLPNNTIQVTSIRAKNHLNSNDDYTPIPRMIGKVFIGDSDG